MFSLAVGGLASSANAAKLTFAEGFPLIHPNSVNGIQPWLKCVKERSKGSITIDHFPGGQVVKYKDSLDAINDGLTQISALVIGYLSEAFPVNGIVLLPDMGIKATESAKAWRATVDANGAMAAEYKKNGVHPLFYMPLPASQILSVGEPIDTLEKFKDVKLRVGGGTNILVANSLGAVPVNMPSSDMYVAMQRNTVDAAIFGLTSAKGLSLNEVMGSMSTNGAFGIGATAVTIDEKTYQSLSDDDRKILDECGQYAEDNLVSFLDAANESIKAEFAGKGIKVYEFAPDELNKISKIISKVGHEYVERLTERNPGIRDAFDAFKKSLGK